MIQCAIYKSHLSVVLKVKKNDTPLSKTGKGDELDMLKNSEELFSCCRLEINARLPCHEQRKGFIQELIKDYV